MDECSLAWERGKDERDQNAWKLLPGVLVRRLTACLFLHLDQWRRQTYKELPILDVLPVSQYTSLDMGWEVERRQPHRECLGVFRMKKGEKTFQKDGDTKKKIGCLGN